MYEKITKHDDYSDHSLVSDYVRSQNNNKKKYIIILETAVAH